jgi:hypothetical protein
LQTTEFTDVFKDGLSQKTAESAKFPVLWRALHKNFTLALRRKRAELAGLLPEAERRLESLRQALTRVNAA